MGLNMKQVTRREVFSVLGLTAGAGLLSGCGGEAQSQTITPKTESAAWKYASLVPSDVAVETYRVMPEGGCMYGVFKGVLTIWSKHSGESTDSFPFHMMRYGEGGIGGWGTVCGALNAGAAIIGLFEKDKKLREKLIAELFAWYEKTDLPAFKPVNAESEIAQSLSASVLCHISVAKWCKKSGTAPLSPQMKERCRRLSADVAAKTVELLNKNQEKPSLPATSKSDTAISKEPPPAIGKMNCTTCHEPTEKHP
jgi:hypothetical protein